MTVKLNVWTHPSTGQSRIYMAGVGGRFTKIWIEEQAPDAWNCTLQFRARDEFKTRGEIGNLLNDAERALNELAGHRVEKFSEALALASKQAVVNRKPPEPKPEQQQGGLER